MRNVIVTGGAGGLGWEVARRFLARGERVIIADANAEAVESRRTSIESDGTLIAERVDMGDPGEVLAFFRGVIELYGAADVLVNNVGIAGPTAAVEQIGLEDWTRTLSVNLTGALVAVQAVLPGMIERQSGAIINVSTGSVKTALPHRAAYVVSKAGLESLSLVIAREAGRHGVTCNVVRPGMMDNMRMMDVLRRSSERTGRPVAELEAEQLNFISMRTKVSMSEVAATIDFLASADARHVTGQIVAVDAGFEWES